MDLFTLIKVVLSHWRVVVPVGLVTLGVAFMVQTSAAAEYEATGYVVLEAPEWAGESGVPAVDPVQLAEGIQLDGDLSGRNFTVTSLGGTNYNVAAAAATAEQAELDAEAVVAGLGQRIATVQEQGNVPDARRVDLRLVEPQIVAEEQADGTYLATATAFLNDPTQATINPYTANAETGRLMQVAVSGDAGRAQFASELGQDITFEITQESRDAAPLLSITTLGPDPQRVIEGFYVTHELMAADLEARQARASVGRPNRLTLGILDAPIAVADMSPPVERAAVGVVALGGMLALGAVVALEALERRRESPGGSFAELLGQSAPTAGSVGTDRVSSVRAALADRAPGTSTRAPGSSAAPARDGSTATDVRRRVSTTGRDANGTPRATDPIGLPDGPAGGTRVSAGPSSTTR